MEYYCEGAGRSNMQGTLFEEPTIRPREFGIIANIFDPNTDAWIKTIYVDPRDRGQGYGSKMLIDFIEECYFNGVRRILGALVPSTDSNEASVIAWYQSHGFEIIEPKAGYKYIYKELEY